MAYFTAFEIIEMFISQADILCYIYAIRKGTMRSARASKSWLACVHTERIFLELTINYR